MSAYDALKKPEKLMIIVATLTGGGQERIACMTADILGEQYEITFVIFDDTDAKYEVSKKARLINLNIPSTSNVIKKMANVLRRSKKVRELKKRYGIEVSLSIGQTSNIVNILSMRGEKTISSVRTSSKQESRKCLIDDLVYKGSDKITFISEGLRQRAARLYPKESSKFFLTYNPCDVESVVEESKADLQGFLGAMINEHTLVAVGRFVPQKGHINLINAIALVKKNIKDVRLLIIGEGFKEQDYRNRIAALGLENIVYLIGFTPNPFRIISRCGAFVLSSVVEGFGNVVVEALACGLPIVSTDCPYGPREIISDDMEYSLENCYEIKEHGILCPVFDMDNDSQPEKEKIMADAIIRILTDRELNQTYRDTAVERSRKFSIEEYAKVITAVINE